MTIDKEDTDYQRRAFRPERQQADWDHSARLAELAETQAKDRETARRLEAVLGGKPKHWESK